MCTDSDGSLRVEQSWKKFAMSVADADQGRPRTLTIYSPLLSSSSERRGKFGSSNQPIRTRYLGHVTGYQPIRDEYFQ